MKIGVASDHAAVVMRQAIAEWLTSQGHEVLDLGPAPDVRVDYPDYAAQLCQAVVTGRVERGVLACGTGIGMSIAANKVRGIRAALVHDPYTAEMAAAHNHANVLCVGGRILAPDYGTLLVERWLATPFEERHVPRLDKITALEDPDGEP